MLAGAAPKEPHRSLLPACVTSKLRGEKLMSTNAKEWQFLLPVAVRLADDVPRASRKRCVGCSRSPVC